MTAANVLNAAAAYAVNYVETLDTRPVGTTAPLAELRARLTKPLPETGTDSEQVIRELIDDAAGGILGSTSGRGIGTRAVEYVL